jgi:polyferredoxin
VVEFLPAVVFLFSFSPAIIGAADRVPRPEFQTQYQSPQATTPEPRSPLLEYLDVAVLGLALAGSGWLAIRMRSREGIYLLSAASIVYFGFIRKGCICPIGSIQNVALALADPSYTLPFVAVAFFALPLLAALFTGRSFCGAVCPFGALQDAVIVKPLRLPRWLSVPLGFLPVVYLSLDVLFAATGADFVVCRFDPFVSFFRMGGSLEMLALGACFLLLGTVVARPYCRFLCPYGLILRWLSRLSISHTTVSPDQCVNCTLCAEACPVDAIRAPTAAPAVTTRGEKRVFRVTLAALPVLVGLGAFAGWQLSPLLARVHPTVRLAAQVMREDAGLTTSTTLESDTFRSTKTAPAELERDARAVQQRFAIGGPLIGGFIMAALAASFLAAFLRRRRTEHQADKGECVGCGRCFSYCPREHLRLREPRP